MQSETLLRECRKCGAKHEGVDHICMPYGVRVRRVEQERARLAAEVDRLQRKIEQTDIPGLEAQIRELTAERDRWKFETEAAHARNAELRADLGRLRAEKVDVADRLEQALGALLGLASVASQMHGQLSEDTFADENGGSGE